MRHRHRVRYRIMLNDSCDAVGMIYWSILRPHWHLAVHRRIDRIIVLVIELRCAVLYTSLSQHAILKKAYSSSCYKHRTTTGTHVPIQSCCSGRSQVQLLKIRSEHRQICYTVKWKQYIKLQTGGGWFACRWRANTCALPRPPCLMHHKHQSAISLPD